MRMPHEYHRDAARMPSGYIRIACEFGPGTRPSRPGRRTCTTLDLERMMPAMHSGASCGSILSQIVTWVQIMETLAAAASAPVFMRLPETQLQCKGRQVMAAMSVSPIVPEGWKYTMCNLPACEQCAVQGCLPVRSCWHLHISQDHAYHDHVDTLLTL